MARLRLPPRGVIETGTYALMHFLGAVAVAYALTRNLAVALSISVAAPLVRIGGHAPHERVWSRAR